MFNFYVNLRSLKRINALILSFSFLLVPTKTFGSGHPEPKKPDTEVSNVCVKFPIITDPKRFVEAFREEERYPFYEQSNNKTEAKDVIIAPLKTVACSEKGNIVIIIHKFYNKIYVLFTGKQKPPKELIEPFLKNNKKAIDKLLKSGVNPDDVLNHSVPDPGGLRSEMHGLNNMACEIAGFCETSMQTVMGATLQLIFKRETLSPEAIGAVAGLGFAIPGACLTSAGIAMGAGLPTAVATTAAAASAIPVIGTLIALGVLTIGGAIAGGVALASRATKIQAKAQENVIDLIQKCLDLFNVIDNYISDHGSGLVVIAVDVRNIPDNEGVYVNFIDTKLNGNLKKFISDFGQKHNLTKEDENRILSQSIVNPEIVKFFSILTKELRKLKLFRIEKICKIFLEAKAKKRFAEAKEIWSFIRENFNDEDVKEGIKKGAKALYFDESNIRNVASYLKFGANADQIANETGLSVYEVEIIINFVKNKRSLKDTIADLQFKPRNVKGETTEERIEYIYDVLFGQESLEEKLLKE